MAFSSFRLVRLSGFALVISGCALDGLTDKDASSVAGDPDPATPDPDRYIVKLKSGERISPSLEAFGGSVLLDLPSVQASVAQLDPSAVDALRQDPSVEYVEPDAPRYLFGQTTPYGITLVQGNLISPADTANRTVCIIDSSLKRMHEDHKANPNITGTNVDATGGWWDDTCGHGTHVAGTVAAVNNTIGVVGVAPGIKLHIIKVFQGCRWAYTSELVDAMALCKDAGANIINMSFGGAQSSEAESTAIQALYDEGMLIIAAAGNGGNTATNYPAGYPSVISVGAVDSNQTVADFSQRNDDVELAAPGVDVLSTSPQFRVNYTTLSGTSMASPHVSGVAALVWSHHPSWTNAQVRDAMTMTAKDLGMPGRDSSYGFGLVQAKAALDLLNASP